MDPYIGEIRIFPFNFAPVGWAMCSGQIMAIQQNTALFSILGTQFGGNGTSTFGLPNLVGAVPLNQGGAPGLSTYVVGESGGTANVTLLQSEIPTHSHSLNATTEQATLASPSGALLSKGHYNDSATGKKGAIAAYTTFAPNTPLSSRAIGITGGSLPHNNLMPYLALNFCISLTGYFPPRS